MATQRGNTTSSTVGAGRCDLTARDVDQFCEGHYISIDVFNSFHANLFDLEIYKEYKSAQCIVHTDSMHAMPVAQAGFRIDWLLTVDATVLFSDFPFLFIK